MKYEHIENLKIPHTFELMSKQELIGYFNEDNKLSNLIKEAMEKACETHRKEEKMEKFKIGQKVVLTKIICDSDNALINKVGTIRYIQTYGVLVEYCGIDGLIFMHYEQLKLAPKTPLDLLETYDIVECRNGNLYVIIEANCTISRYGLQRGIGYKIGGNGFITFGEYDSELLCIKTNEYDVMKVYRKGLFHAHYFNYFTEEEHEIKWKRNEAIKYAGIRGVRKEIEKCKY